MKILIRLLSRRKMKNILEITRGITSYPITHTTKYFSRKTNNFSFFEGTHLDCQYEVLLTLSYAPHNTHTLQQQSHLNQPTINKK